MQVSEEQIQALEVVHGSGMVVVLSVGEDEFAFRRPNEADVDFLLDAKEREDMRFLEDALVWCALCPDEPGAVTGKSDKLAAVKKELAALFAATPLLKDRVPLAWASECGWGAVLETERLSDSIHRLTARAKLFDNQAAEPQTILGCSPWRVEVQATVLTVAQYDKLRKLDLQQGNASDRFAWKEAVCGEGKAEIERLYPFLPVSMGSLIRGLGAQSLAAVSVKKRHPGQVPSRSRSTSESASKATSG